MGTDYHSVVVHWIGWYRIGNRERWRKMVKAESGADCWRLLERDFTDGQMVVLPAQRRPLELKRNTVVAKSRREK
jgi:hypothetical protein